MRPEVAHDALLATHCGLSWILCGHLHTPPWRLSPDLVRWPPECGHGADPVWLPLPSYFLADEKAQPLSHREVYCPRLSVAA